jgi:hypothetical protein
MLTRTGPRMNRSGARIMSQSLLGGAARKAARQDAFVVNARCDVFHLQYGEERTRFAATV